MGNPYLLPDGYVQIALSGGRTSAFMLHEVLGANGTLPDRVRVVFCNTGREMPETLDFIREIGDRWQVHIDWVEYRADKPLWESVEYKTASRDGEPFRQLIQRKKYLPNQVARFCTIELKVRTAKRFLRSLGWDYWTNCIGFRADEPSRIQPEGIKLKDRWSVWQPLNHANITKRDVVKFWQGQRFDLQLANVNGSTPLGNCDGCFLKSEANLAALARDYPDRHKWWEDMEALASSLTSGSGGQFRPHYSRAELGDLVSRQGDWIFDIDGALCQADDGECVG